MCGIQLPRRNGAAPLVSGPVPQEQITQNAPVEFQQRLLELAAALPAVEIGPSHVCRGGTRACHLAPSRARGPVEAFLAGTEFAHLHPSFDGSLHLVLPPEATRLALAAGWGTRREDGVGVLVYGPRDEAELAAVWTLLRISFHYGLDGTT